MVRYHLVDLGVNGKMALTSILKEQGLIVWAVLILDTDVEPW